MNTRTPQVEHNLYRLCYIQTEAFLEFEIFKSTITKKSDTIVSYIFFCMGLRECFKETIKTD